MSDTFYPFVENSGDAQESDDDEIIAPKQPARIAVYDSMTVPPRVVTVPPSDVRTYLDEITKNVWELATQQGGDWPWHIIRELVENYIHAQFIEPTISIMDRGQTISFSDQGPGIPNKQAALRPTFSSATKAMKRYIRGTGSGLPMVEATVKLQHGSISIEDNLGQGAVITVSLAHKDEPAPGSVPNPDTATGASQNAAAPYPAGMQAQVGYPMAGQGGYPQGMGQGQPLNMYGMPQSGAQGFQQGAYPGPQGYAPAGQTMYGQSPMQPGVSGGNPGYAQGTPGQAWQQQPQSTYPQAPMPAAQQQGAWNQPGAMPYGQAGMPQTPPGGWNPYTAGTQWPANAVPMQGMPYGEASQAPQAAFAPASNPQGVNAPLPQGTTYANTPFDQEEVQIISLFFNFEKVGGTEVAQATGMSNATAGRRLQKIAEAGFIVKNGQKYVLTEAGHRLLGEIAQGR